MERGYRESGAWSLPLSLEPYVDAVVASYKSLSRSSLRTQGPITPGLRSEKRPLLKCRSESPRRMGPCVRRDDSLENSICDSLAHKGEGIDRMRGQVSGAISALLTPPKFVIRYNYSRQDVISRWETPDPPRPPTGRRCSRSRRSVRCYRWASTARPSATR